jgi:hypothetical protein
MVLHKTNPQMAIGLGGVRQFDIILDDEEFSRLIILTEHVGVGNLKGPQSEQPDSPASQIKFPKY